MSNEANKALVRRYLDEIWNHGHQEKEREFVAEKVIVHAPPVPGPGSAAGPPQLATMFRAALPDLSLNSDIVFGDGDRVVLSYMVTGTHTGTPLFGVPASGRPLTISGINIFRIKDGKITERWGLVDNAGLMQQLRAKQPASGSTKESNNDA